MNAQKLGNLLIARASAGEINVAELQQYARDEVPYVRSCVAIAVGKIKETGRYDLWLTLLEDAEELVVGDAITASVELDDSRCILKLQEMYSQKGFQVRTRIINALAQNRYPAAMQILTDLQKEEQDSVLSKIIKETLLEMQK